MVEIAVAFCWNSIILNFVRSVRGVRQRQRLRWQETLVLFVSSVLGRVAVVEVSSGF